MKELGMCAYNVRSRYFTYTVLFVARFCMQTTRTNEEKLVFLSDNRIGDIPLNEVLIFIVIRYVPFKNSGAAQKSKLNS